MSKWHRSTKKILVTPTTTGPVYYRQAHGLGGCARSCVFDPCDNMCLLSFLTSFFKTLLFFSKPRRRGQGAGGPNFAREGPARPWARPAKMRNRADRQCLSRKSLRHHCRCCLTSSSRPRRGVVVGGGNGRTRRTGGKGGGGGGLEEEEEDRGAASSSVRSVVVRRRRRRRPTLNPPLPAARRASTDYQQRSCLLQHGVRAGEAASRTRPPLRCSLLSRALRSTATPLSSSPPPPLPFPAPPSYPQSPVRASS